VTTQRALYPGSFDPLTNGHVRIIERGLELYDTVVIAVARNISKTGMFALPERLELIHEVFADNPRVEVDSFEGLLVDYAHTRGIRVILRGLRAVADFEYEYQMANMNRTLQPGIDTVFLMADPSTFFVSSRLVKEVASLGGSVRDVVPPAVERRLYKHLGRE
jgi:pantetheine-phosphate adenylyltransferase